MCLEAFMCLCACVQASEHRWVHVREESLCAKSVPSCCTSHRALGYACSSSSYLFDCFPRSLFHFCFLSCFRSCPAGTWLLRCAGHLVFWLRVSFSC